MATKRSKMRQCPHCGEIYRWEEFAVMFRRDDEAPCRACRKLINIHGPGLTPPKPNEAGALKVTRKD